MIVGAVVVWLLIGGVFGFFRAREKYREEVALYPALFAQDPGAIKRGALVEAGITWALWMILGLFAAVAFVAWMLFRMYMRESRRR